MIGWIKPLAALFLLNGLLSFSTWWPTPGILPDARIAPEFILWWAVVLIAYAVRRSISKMALFLMAVLYLLLVLGRYLDVTAPSLFGRAVSLYWDIPQIPRFIWVTAAENPWWLSALVGVAITLFLWGLFRLIRGAMAMVVAHALPFAVAHRSVWLLTAAAVLLAAANYAGVRATWPYVSKPVVPTYWNQLALLWQANSSEELNRALPAQTVIEEALQDAKSLSALQNKDVYLIFLESFGAVLYDNPEARARTERGRAALLQSIQKTQRHVVSAFFSSPTIGGASDLAHMSLLAGVDLSDPRRHDLLLTTARPTLISLFRKAGYQTFGLYHAVSWAWPEKAYYNYDVYLDGRALNYRGPSIGFWHIPDQFAIARFEQMHPRRGNQPPRFLFFPTISSHFPFSPVPPYQPDWRRILSDQPFNAQEMNRVRAEKVNWLNMAGDYLRSIDYTFDWLTGYIAQPEPRDTVIILIGDHQPSANVMGDGQPWHVPVFVIAKDRALLARFESQGFQPGLSPDRTVRGGMHDLTQVLLKAFGN